MSTNDLSFKNDEDYFYAIAERGITNDQWNLSYQRDPLAERLPEDESEQLYDMPELLDETPVGCEYEVLSEEDNWKLFDEFVESMGILHQSDSFLEIYPELQQLEVTNKEEESYFY